MNYREAFSFLYGFADYTGQNNIPYNRQTYNTDRVSLLLEMLDNPQNNFASVHIAGTKGKGSTSAMVESIMRAGGWRTGLFTSPHLHSLREYFRVNGEPLGEEDVAEGVEKIKPFIEKVEGITLFEILTALAFFLFSEQNTDIAIIEALMGGRLDATNVINPIVTAITSISYDHTEMLGNTLSSIAGEKAGIIKPGIPVITAPQKPEALGVIEDRARSIGAPFISISENWELNRQNINLQGQSFDLREIGNGRKTSFRIKDLNIPLLGEHQLINANLAIAIVYELSSRGFTVSEESIRDGLKGVVWPGRLEILSHKPYLIVDGAHNSASVKYLTESLVSLFGETGKTLIFGASTDKDIVEMLENLHPHFHEIILTSSHHKRAEKPEKLLEMLKKLKRNASIAECAEEALKRALKMTEPEELILVTGSLYLVADAREAWFKISDLPLEDKDPY
ncbi:MAG: bifunctional folylpolyglutamate synthase/dihydrofolate synthase [Spirochaetes bacterium]|nr:MAG: bifunctional folylpolyglutamate synthase/dihydrofolate synthase [Spirochaetota bacterium]